MKQDIRVDMGFLGNLKTRKLKRALGDEGIVCLFRLWCYVAEKHPKGVLTGVGIEDLEEIAGWTGERGAFASYATRMRWVDQAADGVLSVHDWPEHQPYIFHSDKRSEAAKVAASAKWNKYKKQDVNARRKRGACDPDAGRNAAELSTGGKTAENTEKGAGLPPPETPNISGTLCAPHADRYAPAPNPYPLSQKKDLPPAAGATAGGFEAPAVPPKPTRSKDACAFIGGCEKRGSIKHSNGQWYCRRHDPDLPPPSPPGNGAGKEENRTPLPPSIRALNLSYEKSASIAPIFLRHLAHPILNDDLAAELLGAGLDANEVFRTAQAFFGSPGKH